ncbi:MAG: porin family protein [Firmicutes bacterium]|nr:porin family protein [Bacillota bacterium]
MRAAVGVQKRLVVWLIVAIALGLVGFDAPAYGTEVQSIDIPLGHWSYAAVESLAETPLVARSEVLFDSKTSITRYEMAMLIARMLSRLDDMGGSGQELSDSIVSGSEKEILEELFAAAKQSDLGKGTLTDEHLELIIRLVEGFNSELRALGVIRPAKSVADYDLLLDPFESRSEWWSLLGRSNNDDPFIFSSRRSVISSDSTVLRGGDWELGVSISTLLGEADDFYDPLASEEPREARSVTALEGRLQVTPGVRVLGEYAANPAYFEDASSMRVGAEMRLGDVEVGASYRSVRPQFDPLLTGRTEGKESTGYEVSVQYRDVMLSTGKERQASIGENGEPEKTVTSIGLEYGLSDGLVLRANYEYVDIDQLEGDDSTRRSRVGVGVSIPKGSVSLGFIYDQDPGSGRLSARGASADIAHEVPWDSQSVLQAGVSLEDSDDNQKTTSLSLGYNYRKEAALVLGYKMIDFTEAKENGDGKSENIATAELSIKF